MQTILLTFPMRLPPTSLARYVDVFNEPVIQVEKNSYCHGSDITKQLVSTNKLDLKLQDPVDQRLLPATSLAAAGSPRDAPASGGPAAWDVPPLLPHRL